MATPLVTLAAQHKGLRARIATVKEVVIACMQADLSPGAFMIPRHTHVWDGNYTITDHTFNCVLHNFLTKKTGGEVLSGDYTRYFSTYIDLEKSARRVEDELIARKMPFPYYY